MALKSVPKRFTHGETMNRKNGKPDGASEPLREIQVPPFELATAFKHLEGAPLAEVETCDTLPLVSIDLRKSDGTSNDCGAVCPLP